MIELKNISHHFQEGTPVLQNINLKISEGETFALLGTSGSGKSTTLKLINGLINPQVGDVSFCGQKLDYQQIFSTRLKMGYVIQSAGLFPHMSVYENISIMAKMLEWDESKKINRVKELLDLVKLDADVFMSKYPLKLSGGEQQRVGVARALMLDPPCLLMDEPFGALDPITRHQLQNDFLNLEKIINKTIVLVTHDVKEAAKLAKRAAILNKGQLIQCDTIENIQNNPATTWVEEFLRIT
ncbi:hypothetical protein BVY03_04805 [bacterium K02(2017)]|nr:hypothetical protein BVY03_04805 [bacterium K02(2017)]